MAVRGADREIGWRMMRMNGKTLGCRSGEKRVMNYSSRVEDGRTGCQLTNQAERGRERGREPS